MRPSCPTAHSRLQAPLGGTWWWGSLHQLFSGWGFPSGPVLPTQAAEAASPGAFRIQQKEELRASEAPFSTGDPWARMPTPTGHPHSGHLPLWPVSHHGRQPCACCLSQPGLGWAGGKLREVGDLPGLVWQGAAGSGLWARAEVGGARPGAMDRAAVAPVYEPNFQAPFHTPRGRKKEPVGPSNCVSTCMFVCARVCTHVYMCKCTCLPACPSS